MLDVDIQACVKGNKQAWNHFVQRTSSIIYAAVHRAIGGKAANRNDVDDRVQDVFVRLIRNDCRLLKTFDSNRASLSTWLTLVSRSVVYEQFQKKNLNSIGLDGVEAHALPRARDQVIESESLADITSVDLGCLTDRQRLVVRMLFEEGMSVEEAAQRMDVDPQTIRSTKHKALTRLRQQLPGFVQEHENSSGPDKVGGGRDVSPESTV